MITTTEAWNIVRQHTSPLPSGDCRLSEALQKVLSKPVCADRDMPEMDRSAMDGFAVRASDLASPHTTLTVCGEVAAGSETVPVLRSGECVRIFTGANVPPTADTVVKVEDTCPAQSAAVNGCPELVTFTGSVAPGKNILRRAENAHRGDVLIPAGTRLSPAQIGVCAAVGAMTVSSYRTPRVAIITTGAELRHDGEIVGPHQIRDSNGPMVGACLTLEGHEISLSVSVPDKADLIQLAIEKGLDRSDVVLVTGGVSVGVYDLVPACIKAAGGTVHYHGIAMQPGKPQLFAVFPGGKCLFGLPGNPLSVMTGLQEFVLPALRRLSGLPDSACRTALPVRLAADVPGRKNLERHVLARLHWTATGPEAIPLDSCSSADIVAGGKADGTVIVPGDKEILPAGTWAEFRAWRPVA